MGGIQRWDHVGIAVRSISSAVPMYRDVMDGTFMLGGDDHRLGLTTVQFKLPGNLKVELLSPLDDASYLAGYIDKHGEGFHHATIFVDDVEATMAELESHGYELVDTDLSQATWRETFVRPRSGHGCLLQFVDSNLEWLTPHPTCSLDAVLSGEWRWWRNQVFHVNALPDDYDGTRIGKFLS